MDLNKTSKLGKKFFNFNKIFNLRELTALEELFGALAGTLVGAVFDILVIIFSHAKILFNNLLKKFKNFKLF